MDFMIALHCCVGVNVVLVNNDDGHVQLWQRSIFPRVGFGRHERTAQGVVARGSPQSRLYIFFKHSTKRGFKKFDTLH